MWTARKQVLVFIDDHTDTCDCFAFALEEAGFHVLTANDGAEGIALVQARQPRAIVTNLCMPRVDGFEVCRFVKSHASMRSAAVVLLTGAIRMDGGHRALARHLGVQFMLKPCEPRELVRVLRAMIEASSPGNVDLKAPSNGSSSGATRRDRPPPS
jgi:DNA-binding response OmpR family regulator